MMEKLAERTMTRPPATPRYGHDVNGDVDGHSDPSELGGESYDVDEEDDGDYDSPEDDYDDEVCSWHMLSNNVRQTAQSDIQAELSTVVPLNGLP
jgi:hypothetical protein